MGDTVPLLGDLRGRGASGGGPSSCESRPLKLRAVVPIPETTPGRGLTAIISGTGSERRGGERFAALLVSGVVVDDAAFHPTGDGDDLAADVAGEDVGGQHDDLGCHVLGPGDLPQRHRP